MTQPFDEIFTVNRGFKPPNSVNRSPFPDSIIDGLNVLCHNGVLRRFNQAGAVGGTAAPVLMLVGSTIGGIGSGAVILGPGGGIWAIGSGTAFGAGQSMSASTVMKFLRNGTEYIAGLAAPTPPTIASPLALDADAIRMFGTFSVRVTKKRLLTGHESNGSKISNVVYNRASDGKYKQLRVTIAAQSESFDYYGLYVSPARKGNVGLTYWYDDYPVATVMPIVLDISDAQLSTLLPPTDHFPPPEGTHICGLGGVIASLGCYGGNGMGPSIPGLPESYPPLFTTFFPEGIVTTKGRASDGWIYVLCQNSINVAILTGNGATPMLPRTLIPDTGIGNVGAAALVGSQLYLNIGKPARTVGDSTELDSTFAEDVVDFLKRNGFTAANGVVGYDPDNQLLVWAWGTRAIAQHLPSEQWSTEIQLGSSVVSAATAAQKLYFSTGGSLVTFDTGAAQAWYFITGWKDGGLPMIYKVITEVHGSGEAGVTVAILVNLNSTPQEVQTGLSALAMTGGSDDRWGTYLRGVKDIAVKVSGGSGQNIGFRHLRVAGFAKPKSGR